MTAERDRIAVELWRFVFTQLTEDDTEAAASCPPGLRAALVDPPPPPEVFVHMADALIAAGCRMPEPVPPRCTGRVGHRRCILDTGHRGGHF